MSDDWRGVTNGLPKSVNIRDQAVHGTYPEWNFTMGLTAGVLPPLIVTGLFLASGRMRRAGQKPEGG